MLQVVVAQWSERRQLRSEALGSVPSCIFSSVCLIYHQLLTTSSYHQLLLISIVTKIFMWARPLWFSTNRSVSYTYTVYYIPISGLWYVIEYSGESVPLVPLQFLPYPELVPIRLTPQMVQLLRPHSEAGQLRGCMVHALRALRDCHAPLLSTMDVFVKEPLLDWKVGHAPFRATRDLCISQAHARKQAKALKKEEEICELAHGTRVWGWNWLMCSGLGWSQLRGSGLGGWGWANPSLTSPPPPPPPPMQLRRSRGTHARRFCRPRRSCAVTIQHT